MRKWPEKGYGRFLARLKGHMSIHRTRVKLFDWKIIRLMVENGGQKRNN